MVKRKAMTTEKAREVRAKGHLDALEFAISIGLKKDYENDPKAKKDVVDHNGDTHSVKRGKKRWQIFLYRKSRFETDDAFQSMNGIGQLLISCLDVFPNTYDEYKNNKQLYKEKLMVHMRELKQLFQEKRRVKTFLNKAIFNGGEVNYLTVKHEDLYHVFYNQDVVDIFGNFMNVLNSKVRKKGDTAAQKVVFRYNEKNLADLEIRNSGKNHYKEVLFVMNKLSVIDLLFEKITSKIEYNNRVMIYGTAIKKFKK